MGSVTKEVQIPGKATIWGTLAVPPDARGVVVFAHGSGSGRFSPRNRFVARALFDAGLATLLLDLLTAEEEAEDRFTGQLRFDIGLLSKRVIGAIDWLAADAVIGDIPEDLKTLPVGTFGASTGAAAGADRRGRTARPRGRRRVARREARPGGRRPAAREGADAAHRRRARHPGDPGRRPGSAASPGSRSSPGPATSSRSTEHSSGWPSSAATGSSSTSRRSARAPLVATAAELDAQPAELVGGRHLGTLSYMASEWPRSAAELEREQERLARETPPPWRLAHPVVIAGCFVCFPRGPSGPGAAGDSAWAAAASAGDSAVISGSADAPYEPGLLALREGRLLEAAVRAIDPAPDVVLVDATGRDHPRRAGLALHLGAVLDLPTVGVTHRPLLAEGTWPEPAERGATSPLVLDGEPVGLWLCTRRGTRPLAVHPGWRTDAETARDVVLAAVRKARTPEPLRAARRLARVARAGE